MAKENGDPSDEVQSLCAMGDHFFKNSFLYDSALKYYRQGIDLARKNRLQHDQVTTLVKMGKAFNLNAQPEDAKRHLKEALMISRRHGTKDELAYSLEELGIFYYEHAGYDSAMSCYAEQLAIEEQVGDSSRLSDCLNNIGLIYERYADYNNCYRYFLRAIIIKKALGEDEKVAKLQVNIGISYKNQGAYDLALRHLLDAERYYSTQPQSMQIASCYSTIGNVEMELGNAEAALSYQRKALKIRKEIGNVRGVAGSINNIGEVYKTQGNYDSAIVYLDSALALKEKVDPERTPSTLDLLGEVYFLKKDFPRSEAYYNRALAIERQIPDKKLLATTLNKMGELYMNWEKPELAAKCLAEGREIALATGVRRVLLRNYEITKMLMQRQNRLAEALAFAELYNTLKDTLFNEHKNQAIEELKVRYEVDKKEQEIGLLHEKGKAREVELSRQRLLNYSLGTGAFLIAIIAALSFIAYRSGKKTLRQREIIIEQKKTMLRELHHRVKNNLQAVSSMLDLQQADLTDERAKEAIQSVEHRLNAMLIIHQELYSEAIEPQVNMRDYIRKLTDNLLSSYGYSQSQVEIALEADPVMLEADMALNIGFICNEIIINAFRHAFKSTPYPRLDIFLKEENDRITIRISDNGPGISPQQNLPGKRSFGLRLIHLFTQELKGTIRHVPNVPGTTYELIIPK
jgi:two-component sensor histidine kinase